MPIEQVAPECARLVDLQQEVEWLGRGFGADATALGLPWWPAEGPVWWQEGGYLFEFIPICGRSSHGSRWWRMSSATSGGCGSTGP